MPRGNWTFFALAAALAVLIVFKPQIGHELRGFLSAPLNESEREVLERENAGLKAEIASLQSVRGQLGIGDTGGINPPAPFRKGGINAVVYSRYPFNFKNEIVIGAGADRGVAKGGAVLFGKFLIGEIKEVFAAQSVVRTVFDSDFRASVRVGAAGYDALFEGGLEPMLRLIPKDAQVKIGDAIYSVSPDFPYGLAFGEIEDIKISSDKFFQEASVKVPYDIGVIRAVSVTIK